MSHFHHRESLGKGLHVLRNMELQLLLVFREGFLLAATCAQRRMDVNPAWPSRAPCNGDVWYGLTLLTSELLLTGRMQSTLEFEEACAAVCENPFGDKEKIFIQHTARILNTYFFSSSALSNGLTHSTKGCSKGDIYVNESTNNIWTLCAASEEAAPLKVSEILLAASDHHRALFCNGLWRVMCVHGTLSDLFYQDLGWHIPTADSGNCPWAATPL